jgi:hypothetical protein
MLHHIGDEAFLLEGKIVIDTIIDIINRRTPQVNGPMIADWSLSEQ